MSRPRSPARGSLERHAHPHVHTHEHAHAHPEREPAHDHAHAHAHLEQGPRNSRLARAQGEGSVLYVDAFSGIAGDMFVAALLDLGVPLEELEAALSGLAVSRFRLRTERVSRSGISSLRFHVDVETQQPSRDYATIRALIERADSLSEGAKRLALAAFERLAVAEAQVHGVEVDHVHFHEVGAVDSIVDIVACAVALDHLGARVVCSPLPLGRGFTRSAHGTIPLPAPATLLCLRDAPTYDAGIEGELVTPTGACLVGALAESFAPWPALRPQRVGHGAGARELPDRPNLLRLLLGRPEPSVLHHARGEHVLVETNLDDTSGEVVAFALGRALQAGALDAWATPIGMKKGRPAVTLSILAPRAEVEAMARLLLAETSSLGVRFYPVDRLERARRIVSVDTPFGPIAIKVAEGDGLPENVAPEYESCRAAAETHGCPIRTVYAAALQAYAESKSQR